MTKLCILGPSGRMGRELLQNLYATPTLTLKYLVDSTTSSLLGKELNGVRVSSSIEEALSDSDVYIDFSTPDSTLATLHSATKSKTAAIIGTTGLSSQHHEAMARLQVVAPVLWSANFSLGVNLLLGLAELAAKALPPDFDVEIVEAHHKYKKDAPSGTALALGRAVAQGRNQNFDEVKKLSRVGEDDERRSGQIGFAAIRGGEIVGEHVVNFIGGDERIELSHRANSRAIFAQGALRAASWIAGKSPGSYTMQDVLGIAGK